MITQTMIPVLHDDLIRLDPLDDDFDYLMDLAKACEHTRLSGQELFDAVVSPDAMYWRGYDRATGLSCGVIYLTPHEVHGGTIWRLDAYRDENVVRHRLDRRNGYSYRAARLVIDYAFRELTDTLYSILPVGNRAARVLSLRLGFKVIKRFSIDTYGEFVTLKKER